MKERVLSAIVTGCISLIYALSKGHSGQLMILYYFIDGLGRGGIGSGRGSETAHSISRGDLSCDESR